MRRLSRIMPVLDKFAFSLDEEVHVYPTKARATASWLIFRDCNDVEANKSDAEFMQDVLPLIRHDMDKPNPKEPCKFMIKRKQAMANARKSLGESNETNNI